jgi:hypothetical protein
VDLGPLDQEMGRKETWASGSDYCQAFDLRFSAMHRRPWLELLLPAIVRGAFLIPRGYRGTEYTVRG